jgi:hypothetical protein
MNHLMHRAILDATRLTRAGRVTEATGLLQRVRGEAACVPGSGASKAQATAAAPQSSVKADLVQGPAEAGPNLDRHGGGK